MDIKNISVIGLGAMGTALASRLLKAGYSVKGYDIVEEKISNLIPLGLKPVRSLKEAAEETDLILLSLAGWAVIKEVVEGKEGILAYAQKGQIILDTSTVEPWESKAMAERLEKRGMDWMDVPISGSGAQAMVGNMVFFAGGKKSVYDKVKPVLDKVGKKTVYIGKNGDAAALKLVVNCVLFLNQAAAIEGFMLALKAGLDPKVTLEVLSSGAAASDLIAARGKDMLEGNFQVKGPLRLGVKDIRLMLESAKRLGVMLPMLSLLEQFILQGVYNGWGESDGTVIMKIWEQMAGIQRKYIESLPQTKTQ